MMTTVAYLNEANSIMANKATDLSKVYELLRECDEIVKKIILPEEYEPTKPVPMPEPTKPVKIKKETAPVVVPVATPVVQKKKNPWIEFLQNYALHHDIPYHKVMKIPDIKEKYEQCKKNTQYFEEMKKVPEPEPVVVPVKEKKAKKPKKIPETKKESEVDFFYRCMTNKEELEIYMEYARPKEVTREELMNDPKFKNTYFEWCKVRVSERSPYDHMGITKGMWENQ
jgi:hypothetical protein